MIDISSIRKYFVLFIIGGTLYSLIEIMWRQYSYFSMFILGGLCFITIGIVKECFLKSIDSLLIQQVIATLIITLLELLFGLILNIKLGLEVWDYSNIKFNFKGQICFLYSGLWFFLSLPTIIFYDYLKCCLFKEKRPSYKYLLSSNSKKESPRTNLF